MRARSLRIAQLRTHARVELSLDADLTLVDGPNGAGKTNLLEAIVLASTGRSWRTRTDRELVRHEQPAGRATLAFTDAAGTDHQLALTVHRGAQERSHELDGSPVNPQVQRPLIVLFAPDRLALVQGSPQGRRAHVDHLVAALWPARAEARRAFGAALAQRNALLHRPGMPGIDAWEQQLAVSGVALREARQAAVAEVAPGFAELAEALGISGAPALTYRASDETADAAGLAALLAERRDRDRERGFTQIGPHRDELLLRRDERDLRTFGSQGEQRLAVLALLLAERRLLTEVRGSPPLALLDDVGSELDPGRRRLLLGEVCRYGQAVIATTDARELGQLPSAGGRAVRHVHVAAHAGADIPTSTVTVDEPASDGPPHRGPEGDELD